MTDQHPEPAATPRHRLARAGSRTANAGRPGLRRRAGADRRPGPVGRMRQRNVWAYYTDGADLRAEVGDSAAARSCGKIPSRNTSMPESDGADAERQHAGRTPGGRLLGRRHEDGARPLAGARPRHRHVHLALGRPHLEPPATDQIDQHPSNERGPALSRDGRYLYFASDREGGPGGYDLYVARWDGSEWVGVKPLPASVNTAPTNSAPPCRPTARNSTSPPTAAAATTSSCPTSPRRDSDGRKQRLAQIPKFADAKPVDDLNSDAADVQAALTAAATTSSSRPTATATATPGSRSTSAASPASRWAPQEVDLYIEKGDVTDPAVRMEGFDLLFSAGGGEPGIPALPLDHARGDRLHRPLALGAVQETDAQHRVVDPARDRRPDRPDLPAREMAGHHQPVPQVPRGIRVAPPHRSSSRRRVADRAGDLGGRQDRYKDIEVSIDALAQEELALESIPEETELTDATAVETEKEESEFGAPGFEPTEEAQDVPDSAPAERKRWSRPSRRCPNPSEQPVIEPPAESSLPNDSDRRPCYPRSSRPSWRNAIRTRRRRPPIRTRKCSNPKARRPRRPRPNRRRSPTARWIRRHNQPRSPRPRRPHCRSESVVEAGPPTRRADAGRSATARIGNARPTSAGTLRRPERCDARRIEPGQRNAHRADRRPLHTRTGDIEPGNRADREHPGERHRRSHQRSRCRGGAVQPGDVRLAIQRRLRPAPRRVRRRRTLPPSDLDSAAPDGLPELALENPAGMPMEERETDTGATPADTTAEMFEPAEPATSPAASQAPGEAVADNAATTPADATAVAAAGSPADAAEVNMQPARAAPTSDALPSSEPLTAANLPPSSFIDPTAPPLEEAGLTGAAPADTSNDHFEPGSPSSIAASQGTATECGRQRRHQLDRRRFRCCRTQPRRRG